MKKGFALVLVLSLIVCLSGFVAAGDKATKEECVAKCQEAAAMVKDMGLQATLEKIMDKTGPFVWKDTYIFCIDLDKQYNIAHPIKPKLIGRNLMAAKDANGKTFFAEFINVAKGKGNGWVSYMWPKPGEKKASPKVTYVHKVPGMQVAMLAGIYE